MDDVEPSWSPERICAWLEGLGLDRVEVRMIYTLTHAPCCEFVLLWKELQRCVKETGIQGEDLLDPNTDMKEILELEQVVLW